MDLKEDYVSPENLSKCPRWKHIRENIIVKQHFLGFAGNNFRPGVSGRTCFHQGRRDPRWRRSWPAWQKKPGTWGLGLPTTATSSLVSASCNTSPGWIPPWPPSLHVQPCCHHSNSCHSNCLPGAGCIFALSFCHKTEQAALGGRSFHIWCFR